MSGYEVVISDVEYVWSLGVFKSRMKADEVIMAVKARLGGELADFALTVEPTNEMPRMAILPSSPYYDQWQRVRQRKLTKVPA